MYVKFFFVTFFLLDFGKVSEFIKTEKKRRNKPSIEQTRTNVLNARRLEVLH